jgi:hypothetical protein
MPERTDLMFDNNPVFRFKPGAEAAGLKRVAWFDSARPLRSGWAWGQQYLDGGVAAAEADVGRGKLFLFGPEITFRAQPHGTFRLLFNSLYSAAAQRCAAGDAAWGTRPPGACPFSRPTVSTPPLPTSS